MRGSGELFHRDVGDYGDQQHYQVGKHPEQYVFVAEGGKLLGYSIGRKSTKILT